MSKDKSETYHDFANVEVQRNYLTAEEFPDGAYGSPIGANEPPTSKSGEWKKDQRRYSAYNYEFKNLHQGLPRQMEGAHLPHDEPGVNEQAPYSSNEPEV